MARAGKVYIVKERNYNGEEMIYAAFTVKHELIGWIEKQLPKESNKQAWFEVLTCNDGGRGPVKSFEIKDVLDGKRLV